MNVSLVNISAVNVVRIQLEVTLATVTLDLFELPMVWTVKVNVSEIFLYVHFEHV